VVSNVAFADDAPPAQEKLSVHFQSTTGLQAHPAFSAPYSGKNSMPPAAEAALAFVTTFSFDGRLWKGAEFIFDPEMSGGFGLGKSVGIAAFPSGIVYRVGDPAPALYIARFLLRQTFDLGGGRVPVEAGPNQLAGTAPRDTLTLSAGKLSLLDVFDGNVYAHDATTQFFDWALFASGAWDYPANTRGYTYALTADLSVAWWSIRAGIALEPREANGGDFDPRIDKSRGLSAEVEGRYKVAGHPGAVSSLVFLNTARMGSYAEVLANPARYDNDITKTRADGRLKYGATLSVAQELTSFLSAFLRASINDGANETWAFTEIDRSLGAGVVVSGGPWKRARDQAGVAFVVSGLSGLHERYLAGGGYGFLIGDGKLNYRAELEGDIYYRAAVTDWLDLSAIYQPVVNPAYNADRGPIHVVSARAHVAF